MSVGCTCGCWCGVWVLGGGGCWGAKEVQLGGSSAAWTKSVSLGRVQSARGECWSSEMISTGRHCTCGFRAVRTLASAHTCHVKLYIYVSIHVEQLLSSPHLLCVLANGREEGEMTRGLARRLEGARPRLESDGLALQPRSSAGGALSRTVCGARALSQPRVALRLTARAERNAAALGVPAAPGTRICAGPGPSPWGFCRNTIL